MPTPQRTYHLLGNLITFRAYPQDNGDAFALAEILTAPGAGAPPNYHVDRESFLVLEGEVEFVVEGQARRCRPGDFVNVPANVVHAFTNTGDTPSRMLNINIPGRDHVGFFSLAGDEAPLGTTEFPPINPEDAPRVVRIAAENNVFLLPPNGAGD